MMNASSDVPSPGPGRRGRPARLDLQMIVESAAKIIRRDGPDGVSMRSLAADLHVSPAALYRHVANRDAALVAVLNADVEALGRPEFPESAPERVVAVFSWLYDELDKRPWVVEVLSRGDLYAPAIMWAVEDILDGFTQLGLTPHQAVDAYQAVWRFLVGTLVIRHRSASAKERLAREPIQTTAMQQAQSTALPLIAATADYWPSAREGFDFRQGLRTFVEGIISAAEH